MGRWPSPRLQRLEPLGLRCAEVGTAAGSLLLDLLFPQEVPDPLERRFQAAGPILLVGESQAP